MRKTYGNYGFPRRPVGEVTNTGHPGKGISTNTELLEEILQDAGLEDLNTN